MVVFSSLNLPSNLRRLTGSVWDVLQRLRCFTQTFAVRMKLFIAIYTCVQKGRYTTKKITEFFLNILYFEIFGVVDILFTMKAKKSKSYWHIKKKTH